MSARSLTLTAAAVTFTFGFALTGCVPIATDDARPVTTVRPTAPAAPATPGEAGTPDASTASPAPTGGDCAGEPVAVSSGNDLVLSGDCPRVTVSGTDVDLDLTRAAVGELVIEGDRHDVEAGDVAAASIAGQDNDLEAATVGALVVTGDRNDVGVRGEIGSIAVNGNDNEVEGGSLGDVVDSGARNTIVVDR